MVPTRSNPWRARRVDDCECATCYAFCAERGGWGWGRGTGREGVWGDEQKEARCHGRSACDNNDKSSK
jgi:hypothetical protein